MATTVQNILDNFLFSGGSTPFDAKTYVEGNHANAYYYSLYTLLNNVTYAGPASSQFIGNRIYDLTTAGTMKGRLFRLGKLWAGVSSPAEVELADNRKVYTSVGVPSQSTIVKETFTSGQAIVEVPSPQINDLCINTSTGDIYRYQLVDITLSWVLIVNMAAIAPAYTAGTNISIANKIISLTATITGLSSITSDAIVAQSSLSLDGVSITNFVTTVGETGSDSKIPTEQAVREAIAAAFSAVPVYKAGDNIVINQDEISLDPDIVIDTITISDTTGTATHVLGIDAATKVVQSYAVGNLVKNHETSLLQEGSIPYWKTGDVLTGVAGFTIDPDTKIVSLGGINVGVAEAGVKFDDSGLFASTYDMTLAATISADPLIKLFASTGRIYGQQIVVGENALDPVTTYPLYIKGALGDESYIESNLQVVGQAWVKLETVLWAASHQIDLTATPTNIIKLVDSIGADRSVKITDGLIEGANYQIFMYGGDDASTVTLHTDSFAVLEGGNVFTPAASTWYSFTGVSINISGTVKLHGIVDLASKNLIV